MIRTRPELAIPSAAATRLAWLSPLSAAELSALSNAEAGACKFAARREVSAASETRILVSGWACRTHTLPDGRRQIVGFILPGDFVGPSRPSPLIGSYSILALSDVSIARAPQAALHNQYPGLAKAYAASRGWDEAYLARSVIRLGRLSAYERIADWFLEMFERLRSAGLTQGNSFQMPLTQETLGDALGLTTVHVSRTMQALRQNRVLSVEARHVIIHEPEGMAQILNHHPLAAAVSREAC